MSATESAIDGLLTPTERRFWLKSQGGGMPLRSAVVIWGTFVGQSMFFATIARVAQAHWVDVIGHLLLYLYLALFVFGASYYTTHTARIIAKSEQFAVELSRRCGKSSNGARATEPA